MVGERVRFLFMSELSQANEWACDNSRMNKNRIREPTMMLFVYFISTEISFKITYFKTISNIRNLTVLVLFQNTDLGRVKTARCLYLWKAIIFGFIRFCGQASHPLQEQAIQDFVYRESFFHISYLVQKSL